MLKDGPGHRKHLDTGSRFSLHEDSVNTQAKKVFWLMDRPRAALPTALLRFLFQSSCSGLCGFRHQLQRRVRDGLAPSSLTFARGISRQILHRKSNLSSQTGAHGLVIEQVTRSKTVEKPERFFINCGILYRKRRGIQQFSRSWEGSFRQEPAIIAARACGSGRPAPPP